MPAATPLRDHSDCTLEHDVLGHGVDAQHDELTRFGPDAAGAKINQARAPHLTSSTSTTLSRNNFDFSARHHAATRSSLTSSDDSDAERIELSALRSLACAGRAQSFVGRAVGRGRFESIASASSYSASTSELDGAQGDAIGDRFVERAEDTTAIARSENCYNHLDSVSHFEGASSDQNTPPLSPMPPRLSRYPRRIYVPSTSHHDDERKFKSSLSEVDLEAATPSTSVRSPDTDLLVSAETDSLLPLQKTPSCLHHELPVPAIAPRSDNSDEPRTFRFSFTRVETSIHTSGILTVLVLVILSVWLTLANVVM